MTTTPASELLNIEFYIEVAEEHGEDYPDHEVGDLQDLLRAMWDLTPPEQRLGFAKSPEVHRILAGAGASYEDELTQLMTQPLSKAVYVGIQGAPSEPTLKGGRQMATSFQWLIASPNPRNPATGFDAGQRGWRLHAVTASESATFESLNGQRALCGLLPDHGWSLDAFVDRECGRCRKVADRLSADHALVNPPEPRK